MEPLLYTYIYVEHDHKVKNYPPLYMQALNASYEVPKEFWSYILGSC